VQTVYPGKAAAGDIIRDPDGRLLEVVAVVSAGLWLDQFTDALIAANPGRTWVRHSSAYYAISYGETEGREKRDAERARKRLCRNVAAVGAPIAWSAKPANILVR
jgi:hypothetical protein